MNKASTHAFMIQDTKTDPNLFVLAFRGTEPFDAYGWATDVDLSWYKFKGIGQIHRGFMKALGLQNNGWPKEIIEPDHDYLYAYYEARQMLRDIVSKNEQAKFIVTGHSLGGALAILFVAVLTMHGEAELLERLEGVYTFGQPRVGDEEFGEYMIDGLKKHKVKYLRYVYCNDMVPRVPFDNNCFFYKHFWECKYYTSWYKEKVSVPSLSLSLSLSISYAVDEQLINVFVNNPDTGYARRAEQELLLFVNGHTQVLECCLGADQKFYNPLPEGSRLQRKLVDDTDKGGRAGGSRIISTLSSRLY